MNSQAANFNAPKEDIKENKVDAVVQQEAFGPEISAAGIKFMQYTAERQEKTHNITALTHTRLADLRAQLEAISPDFRMA